MKFLEKKVHCMQLCISIFLDPHSFKMALTITKTLKRFQRLELQPNVRYTRNKNAYKLAVLSHAMDMEAVKKFPNK